MPNGRPKWAKFHSHAALRAYVFFRDGFTCQGCGRTACDVPEDPFDYDGREALMYEDADGYGILVIDHILSLDRGGTNHPDNLQVLCDPCNARKSVLEEGAGRVHV